MATKKADGGKKTAHTDRKMTFEDAVRTIDGAMDELVRLAGGEAEAVRAKWEDLKKGLRRKDAKKARQKPAPKKPHAKTGTVSKTAKTAKGKADQAKPNDRKEDGRDPSLPASVRITDKEIELNLGSFGVRQIAEHDASELIGHPMVFWYRRGVFPDPRLSKVNPTVVSAKVVERTGKAFKAAPFTVRTVISMAGDSARCLAWARGVYARNRGEQE